MFKDSMSGSCAVEELAPSGAVVAAGVGFDLGRFEAVFADVVDTGSCSDLRFAADGVTLALGTALFDFKFAASFGVSF